MTFDHRAPGTPAAEWQSTLDAATQLAVPKSGEHIVVVAAHPDDETLGAGGLIALAARHGAQLTVLVASDGEASHPSSPTHRPDELAQLRRRELHAAVAELAPSATVVLLGLPDGKLADHRRQISAAIDEAGAGCTHLVTPWVADEHPDHAACAHAASESVAALHARHWQFPIWVWHWGDPGNGDVPVDALGRVDLDRAARAAK
ncbi:MAG TPA: PIG-L family deacetylase, partial [Jatrophihabitans sp.]|nr:PIG-L family deacetylase [Jatrophihabitans sp.]